MSDNLSQPALFGEEVMAPVGEEGLAPLRKQCIDCKRCSLSQFRTKAVFGEGCADQPILAFIGEGPGSAEDASGRPFVGPAGRLLDKMIQGMGLQRENTYILNCVACRPPENRTPAEPEIRACSSYLYGQLRAVRPMAIVTLGGTATRTLLNTEKKISELRGRWREWETVPVMPTYHPSFLLRPLNKEFKRLAWMDLQSVMARVGLSNS